MDHIGQVFFDYAENELEWLQEFRRGRGERYREDFWERIVRSEDFWKHLVGKEAEMLLEHGVRFNEDSLPSEHVERTPAIRMAILFDPTKVDVYVTFNGGNLLGVQKDAPALTTILLSSVGNACFDGCFNDEMSPSEEALLALVYACYFNPSPERCMLARKCVADVIEHLLNQPAT